MTVIHRLILMTLEFLEERFFDAKVARVVDVFAFLVLHRTSLIGSILIVIDHVLEGIRDVQHGQVTGVSARQKSNLSVRLNLIPILITQSLPENIDDLGSSWSEGFFVLVKFAKDTFLATDIMDVQLAPHLFHH